MRRSLGAIPARLLPVVVLLLGCAAPAMSAKAKPENIMQEAIQADQSGDYEKATALLLQVTAMKAKDKVLAEANFRLGQLYLDRNKVDDAISSFKTARELKYPEATIRLGIAYHKQGNLDEAEAIFKEQLAILPNNTDLMYRLGKVYLDKGMLNDAGALFRQVLQINPGNGAAHNGLANLFYRQRKLNDAMIEYRTALQLDPNLSDANLDLGNAYFAKGSQFQAWADYHQAKGNPDSARWYTTQAQTEFTQAAVYLRKYTQLSPKDAAGFFMYGKALQSQRDEALLTEAIAAAVTSTRLDDENDGAWYLLAALYRDTKQYSNSLLAFNKALLKSPADAPRWSEAGKVYVEAAKQLLEAKDTSSARAKLDSAIGCYTKVCELDPALSDQATYDIGMASYLAGNYDQAITVFNKRIANNPKTAYSAYMNLGYSLSLKAQGMKAATPTEKAGIKAVYLQAINAFLEAKKLKPDDVRPMEALAQHYYYVGDKFKDRIYSQKAKAECKAILKLDPKNKVAIDLEYLLGVRRKIEQWD